MSILSRSCLLTKIGFIVVRRLQRASDSDYGNGCHADQLLGQWWADLLGRFYRFTF